MPDDLPPPLSGVRVLELAHLIAGPICGMYLADMGAAVVKVEAREAPDAGRSLYPRAGRNGEGVLHLTVNRNKRGICLDVKQPEGRDAVPRPAAWADPPHAGCPVRLAAPHRHRHHARTVGYQHH